MKRVIVQKENSILRKRALEVNIDDIKSKRIQDIIKRMKNALDAEEDGVAIAAPQIGESVRIFVVSKKIFDILENEKKPKNDKVQNGEFVEDTLHNKKRDMVFINPVIIKMSKKKIMMEEGCLSVRWLYGKVLRAEKTLIKAYDQNGKVITFGGSGTLSQVFQHEIDHLNGVLFVDSAKDLKEMPPQK